MNAKNPLENTADASAGAIPEMCTNAAVVVLCAVLVTLAVMVSLLLLLTLPGALDAVAGSPPAIGADAPLTDERHVGQLIADWVDALSEGERAIWRLRSSD